MGIFPPPCLTLSIYLVFLLGVGDYVGLHFPVCAELRLHIASEAPLLLVMEATRKAAALHPIPPLNEAIL